MGRHQFHITLLLACEQWMRMSAKVRRLCSASPHLGFGVPCWCGVGGRRRGNGPAGLRIFALGKYKNISMETKVSMAPLPGSRGGG